jgi:hypothetical protein
MYFAHISHNGPVKYEQVPGSIGVLDSLDKPLPIGEARCVTWDENGLAVWTLRIGGQPIAGRWVIIDRQSSRFSKPAWIIAQPLSSSKSVFRFGVPGRAIPILAIVLSAF